MYHFFDFLAYFQVYQDEHRRDSPKLMKEKQDEELGNRKKDLKDMLKNEKDVTELRDLLTKKKDYHEILNMMVNNIMTFVLKIDVNSNIK